jgi:hypothetical protein
VESPEKKYSQYVPKFLLLSDLRTQPCCSFPGKNSNFIPVNDAKMLELGIFFGMHQRKDKVTYKPNLDSIMTYTTKEGSLICLMIGNDSNISSINA